MGPMWNMRYDIIPKDTNYMRREFIRDKYNEALPGSQSQASALFSHLENPEYNGEIAPTFEHDSHIVSAKANSPNS